MDYESIEFSNTDGVAIIRLNRPERLNSFTQGMHLELREVFETLRASKEVRCLLITGNGKGFCAGQDLNDRKFDPGTLPELGASLTDNYNPLIENISTLEIPVLCAVNGVAAGAGVGIALACDIVLAAKSAKFVLSFSRVGLGMDSGSSWSLPRLIGLPRARGVALLGETISAEAAEEWGMIWKSVEDENLEDEALKLASHFSRQPTKGLAIIKKELLASTANSLQEQLGMEAEMQEIAGRTEDYREGVLSFLEKRKPEFKGK
jgi:2-(1,2-epoxy-1,2-dihydrophenyl)acetyl-CoA isomerase